MQTNIVLLGTGKVGRAVLSLLQRPANAERYDVVGVLNSRGGVYLWAPAPIDIDAIIRGDKLDESRYFFPHSRFLEGKRSALPDPDGERKNILAIMCSRNGGRGVIIDATSSDTLPAWPDEWSRFGPDGKELFRPSGDPRFRWPVVSANKKKLCGPYEKCGGLFRYRRYRYGATVGAGLVISPLRDLVGAGDEIVEITAMPSGTLGYLLSEDGAFAHVLKSAMANGFTEDDPRKDLSGQDVARKALILHRLIGGTLELDDIIVQSLVPAGLQDVPLEEFMRKITHVPSPVPGNGIWRYLAKVTPASVHVGLAQVKASDPFAALKGPENLFVVRTRQLGEHLLKIAGPGAGPGVTAAAVLADVDRVAQWLHP